MIRYVDILTALREGILGGKYDARNPLPSERALMNRYGVSRNAVRHAIDELEKAHLVQRQHGRRTRVVYGRRGCRIGLIPCVAGSEYFVPIASRLSRLCADNGHVLIFSMLGPRDVVRLDVREYAEKLLETAAEFVEQHVAGVLFQPVSFLPDATELNERVLAVFEKAGIPVVLLDYDIYAGPVRSGYDVVGINNIEAGQRIAEHLIGGGARRISFFMRPRSSNVIIRRMRGVAMGATLAGLPWSDANILSCELDDEQAIRRHLTGPNRPDAVVCGFDVMAMHLKKVVDRLRLKVPKDIVICGFDDREVASVMSPPLTTIHEPCEEIAETAFRRLLQRMGDRGLPPQEIFLSAPLVVRDSTKRTTVTKRQEVKHK